jgi:hypothetical protein
MTMHTAMKNATAITFPAELLFLLESRKSIPNGSNIKSTNILSRNNQSKFQY